VDAVTTKWTHALFGADLSGGDTNQQAADQGPTDHGDGGALPTTYGSTDEAEERRRRESTGSLSSSRKKSLLRGARFLIAKEKSLTPLMGEDAVQYLRFQKYITIYVFITTIISCGVVLPVNFQGTLQGNATDFGHTTMANVDPMNKKEKNYLWIHIILSFLLFPLAIFLMRRFSIGLRMQDTSLGITRTVAIENIPHKLCTLENLQAHFRSVPCFSCKGYPAGLRRGEADEPLPEATRCQGV